LVFSASQIYPKAYYELEILKERLFQGAICHPLASFLYQRGGFSADSDDVLDPEMHS
jgi:hypothetical protein